MHGRLTTAVNEGGSKEKKYFELQLCNYRPHAQPNSFRSAGANFDMQQVKQQRRWRRQLQFGNTAILRALQRQ